MISKEEFINKLEDDAVLYLKNGVTKTVSKYFKDTHRIYFTDGTCFDEETTYFLLVSISSPSSLKKAYFIKDSLRQYFCGFRTEKVYETAGPGYYTDDAHGSFTVVQIPIFTKNIQKAQPFFNEDSAKEFITKLGPDYRKLTVVQLNYAPQK